MAIFCFWCKATASSELGLFAAVFHWLYAVRLGTQRWQFWPLSSEQWFSKCSVWTSSTGITQELVRNEKSWASFQTYWSETRVVGPSNIFFTKPSRWFYMHTQVPEPLRQRKGGKRQERRTSVSGVKPRPKTCLTSMWRVLCFFPKLRPWKWGISS